MNKTLLVIVIVILVGLGLYIGYTFAIKSNNLEPQPEQNQQVNNSSQQPNELADWTTYRSRQYGFEIKYPSDFDHSTSTVDTEYGPTEIFTKYFVKETNSFGCNLKVIALEDFNAFLNNYAGLGLKQTNITINNMSVIKIENSVSTSNKEMTQDLTDYLIKRKDGGKFSVAISTIAFKFTGRLSQTYSKFGPADYDCPDVFNKALSTFKFIK